MDVSKFALSIKSKFHKKKFNLFDKFFSTEKELDHVDHGFKMKLILKLD